MSDPQTELKSKTVGLALNAFEAFCEDISGMFGIEMKCVQKEQSNDTTKELSQKFKKLAAITAIKTNGILNGTFNLIFDQAGLFALAGIIIMLPKQRIVDSIKRGTAKDAEGLIDTIKEAGNLLVGSWDRVFREEMEGHGHFLQSGTFIGNPWDNSKEKIGLPDNEQFSVVTFQITIDDYPPFTCGAIFPEQIYLKPAEPVKKEEKPAEPEKPAEKEASANVENTENKEAVKTEKIEENKTVPLQVTENNQQEVKPAIAETVQNKEPATGPVSETIQKMVDVPFKPSENSFSLNLSAQDIMQTNVLWGDPEDSVQQAMTKMQEKEIAYMLIGRDQMPEGIISTYDLASAISVYLKPIFAKWRRPTDDATLQIRVKWIMTRPVRTVRYDTTIAIIMEIICQTGLRCVPVIDANNKVIGLITVFDILKTLLKNGSNNVPANQALPAAVTV